MRVQITLEGDDYAALKKLAEEEDRSTAQQARHMLRKTLGPKVLALVVVAALRDPQSLQGDDTSPETHDVTGSPDHDGNV